MRADSFSIRSHSGAKSTVEKTAQVIFTVCGFLAILAVIGTLFSDIAYVLVDPRIKLDR